MNGGLGEFCIIYIELRSFEIHHKLKMHYLYIQYN